MKRFTLKQAADVLGLSRQRMFDFAREGRIKTKTDEMTGWKYVTEAEITRFQALARPAHRPKKSST